MLTSSGPLNLSLITQMYKKAYTLFQNGRHFSILLFDCKLALLASFKVKYALEFYVWKWGQMGQFAVKQKNTKIATILE